MIKEQLLIAKTWKNTWVLGRLLRISVMFLPHLSNTKIYKYIETNKLYSFK
ncbi:hypothetical protein PROFFT_A_06930 [Candidatus Profftia tarda]|uniref:Uncharacterized protein n=1 Tax=Candidatus Profftia tarda TaxID=1177216 RepID=A0A8E4GIZ7_9ENTR|nr:hypothetical protein PROFFT_A_06930 [Candidatus Profftia tarda]